MSWACPVQDASGSPHTQLKMLKRETKSANDRWPLTDSFTCMWWRCYASSHCLAKGSRGQGLPWTCTRNDHAMHSKSCCTMLHHTWWIQVMWIVRMTGLQTRFHHPSSIGNSKPGSGATRAIALFLLPQMHPLSTLESQHGLPILSSSQCPLFTCKVQQLSAHESAQ